MLGQPSFANDGLATNNSDTALRANTSSETRNYQTIIQCMHNVI